MYFSYDLWYIYTRDDPHDKNAGKKFLSIKQCKRKIEDVREGGVGGDKYCRELLAATDTARVMTLLALLLTVVGARGLCRYRRSPNEATRVKSFERCCGLLAIGGLIGLISAATYTSMMEKAAKELYAEKNFFTDTRAAGCALSLAASIISMVTGAAAVVLQRKWPGASDPGTQASKPTKPATGKKMGGCCAGDPKVHGCGAVPDGSENGPAAQVTSSLGLILAVSFLIVNFVYYLPQRAVVFMHLDLPGAGIGIYIQLLCLFLSIIAYSRGLCCVTGERGWNCTAGFLRVLSVLYVVAIVCIATSHSNIDTAIDKECEEDDDDCDWVSAWLDRVFDLLYASAALNLAFTAVTAYLLNHVAPDWVERDAGEDDDTKPVSEGDIELCGRKVTVEQRFRRMTAFGCLCVVCQLVAALGLGHWAHIELEYDLWRRKLQSSRCDSSWTFEPVSSWYCPYSPSSLPDCDSSSTACGAMCEADGECGTSTSLDNCGYGYDVYTKYCSTSTSYDDDLWRSFDGDLTIYLSYDLWKSYYRNDEDDDDTDEEKLYGSKCNKDDDFCEDLVSATDVARITTLLALLLTVVGVFGLWRYRRSPDAEARAKRFERCCGLLAVGGFAGLVGASNYSSKMTTAVKDNLDTSINDLDTCAAGCALSLSFGLIATVVGAAAVFLQRKYAIGEAPAEAPSVQPPSEEASAAPPPITLGGGNVDVAQEEVCSPRRVNMVYAPLATWYHTTGKGAALRTRFGPFPATPEALKKWYARNKVMTAFLDDQGVPPEF